MLVVSDISTTAAFLNKPEQFDCYRPSVTAHAQLQVWQTFLGVVATYTCDTGYHFIEGGTARTIICTRGAWNAPVGECQGWFPPAGQSRLFRNRSCPVIIAHVTNMYIFFTEARQTITHNNCTTAIIKEERK